MGYIYLITNTINQKRYIGQTTKTRPTDRFSQHKYLARHPEQEKYNSILHDAMRKYGVDNFSFNIVEEAPNDLLNEKEIYWISFYNTKIPNGYNLTDGGDGTKGFSRLQSDEERLQKSYSMRKFFEEHPERKEELRERTLQLWQNPEYREKVTKSIQQFYQNNPDFFKGEKNPFYGKHHSKESLEKIKTASRKRQRPIAQLDKETLEIIQIFDGVKDAEYALGVSHGWISKAARQDKIAYGFRWKFV